MIKDKIKLCSYYKLDLWLELVLFRKYFDFSLIVNINIFYDIIYFYLILFLWIYHYASKDKLTIFCFLASTKYDISKFPYFITNFNLFLFCQNIEFWFILPKKGWIFFNNYLSTRFLIMFYQLGPINQVLSYSFYQLGFIHQVLLNRFYQQVLSTISHHQAALINEVLLTKFYQTIIINKVLYTIFYSLI